MSISVSDELQRDKHISSDINSNNKVLQHTVSSDIEKNTADGSLDANKELEPPEGIDCCLGFKLFILNCALSFYCRYLQVIGILYLSVCVCTCVC